MDLIATFLCTALGIVASWYFSRLYFFKAKPEYAATMGLRAAIRRATVPGGASPGPLSTRVPLQWVLEIINAYEAKKLYTSELSLLARALGDGAELLRKPLESASLCARNAGQTLSKEWQDAYENELRAGLTELREQILQKLSDKGEVHGKA